MNLKSILAVAALSTSSFASAVPINFTGNIGFHNDIITTYFTLDQDATNVRVWTDSFQNGINFDPIVAVWNADGTLIDESDDNATIDPLTQTHFDAGFAFNNLAKGDYIFTVATFNNFAQSTQLNDGFDFDSQTAIALSDWSQPSNGNNMGGEWSVWMDGVDSGSVGVPEPTTVALLTLGLFGLTVGRKRKNK